MSSYSAIPFKIAFAWARKNLLIVGAVAGAAALTFGYFQFQSWKADLKKEAYASGFKTAEDQYRAAVNAANEKVAKTNTDLSAMRLAFEQLALAQQREINITLDPIQERITREIASDPIYRECAVSERVLDDLNAGRAAVNEIVAASAPAQPGS